VPGGELRLVMALPGVRTHHAPDPNAADERKTALQASRPSRSGHSAST